MPDTDRVVRSPFAPDLLLAMKALSAAALLTAVVDLLATPHRAVSAAFVVAGLLAGWGLGRELSHGLHDWCEDAPALDPSAPVADAGPGRVAIGVLSVLVLAAVLVPLASRVPTPLPALLLAAAVQSEQALRTVRRMERRRGGIIVRPAGRMFFDERELRLLPTGTPAIGSPTRADGGARRG